MTPSSPPVPAPRPDTPTGAEEGDAYDLGWAAAHADLLILTEPQRQSAREVVADFVGGDFNEADNLIGSLRRAGFHIINGDAVHIAPSAAAALAAAPGDAAERVRVWLDARKALGGDEIISSLSGADEPRTLTMTDLDALTQGAPAPNGDEGPTEHCPVGAPDEPNVHCGHWYDCEPCHRCGDDTRDPNCDCDKCTAARTPPAPPVGDREPGGHCP